MESRAYGYLLPRDRRAVDRLDATMPEATIRDPGPTTEHQEDASYNNSSVLNLAVSDLRR